MSSPLNMKTEHAADKSQDVLERLQYIADSPSREHGGFHDNAIQTAKDAIAALTAEREQSCRNVSALAAAHKKKFVDERDRNFAAENMAWKEIQQLRNQLAAADKDRCRLSEGWTLTERKLAAAQAAIAQVMREDGHYDECPAPTQETHAMMPHSQHVRKCIALQSVGTTALDAAIEQKRLEIWANAPNQPDIQESVIAKLDLVHRHAIATATKPLVDALKEASEDLTCSSANETHYCPNCDNSLYNAKAKIDAALEKMKEGKV